MVSLISVIFGLRCRSERYGMTVTFVVLALLLACAAAGLAALTALGLCHPAAALADLAAAIIILAGLLKSPVR